MDSNFYKTELYERERRKEEIRQAQQAHLARLARSNAAFNRSIRWAGCNWVLARHWQAWAHAFTSSAAV